MTKQERECPECGREMRSPGLIRDIGGTTSRYYYCPWCGTQVTIQVGGEE